MSLSHNFSVDLAERVGVESAILLSHFAFWHKRNQAAKKNHVDGRYWSYNTAKSIAEQYPYWSEKQVRTILANIEKRGLLVTAHHGGNDRTTWYALTDNAIELVISECPNEKVRNQFPKRSNGTSQTVNSNLPNGKLQLTKREIANDQTGNCILPNGQMLYKDTVINTDINQLGTQLKKPAVAFAPVLGENSLKPVKAKKEKKAPRSAPPPQQDAPIVTRIRAVVETKVTGYYWQGKDGKAAQQIAAKLKASIIAKTPEAETAPDLDDKIEALFIRLVERTAELPAFYQFSDLPKLNTQYNEILTKLTTGNKPGNSGQGGRIVAPAHRSREERASNLATMFNDIDRAFSEK